MNVLAVTDHLPAELGLIGTAIAGFFAVWAAWVTSGAKAKAEGAEKASDRHTDDIADLRQQAGSWQAVVATVAALQESLSSAVTATAKCEQERHADREHLAELREQVEALQRVVAVKHPDLAAEP